MDHFHLFSRRDSYFYTSANMQPLAAANAQKCNKLQQNVYNSTKHMVGLGNILILYHQYKNIWKMLCSKHFVVMILFQVWPSQLNVIVSASPTSFFFSMDSVEISHPHMLPLLSPCSYIYHISQYSLKILRCDFRTVSPSPTQWLIFRYMTIGL